MPSRRSALILLAGGSAALALGAPTTAHAHGRPGAHRPFGRYGSPSHRIDASTLYVDAGGRGDHTTVQAAVDAATGTGRTLVIAPGTYRETVDIPADRTGLTLIGASDDPHDTVIVYSNANGTPGPTVRGRTARADPPPSPPGPPVSPPAA